VDCLIANGHFKGLSNIEIFAINNNHLPSLPVRVTGNKDVILFCWPYHVVGITLDIKISK